MQEIRKICESQQGDARKLGFFKHPLYFQASEDRISFDQRRQLANMYMYSLDVHAQYRKMEQQKKSVIVRRLTKLESLRRGDRIGAAREHLALLDTVSSRKP